MFSGVGTFIAGRTSLLVLSVLNNNMSSDTPVNLSIKGKGTFAKDIEGLSNLKIKGTAYVGKLVTGIVDPYLIENDGLVQPQLEIVTTPSLSLPLSSSSLGTSDIVFEPGNIEKLRIKEYGDVVVSTNLSVSGDTSVSGNLNLSSTSPIITIGNTGTVTFTDGTNTLMSLSDSGTTGNLTLTGAVTASNISSGGTISGSNTGDQTITLTGDITGSGTGSFATTLAATGVTATSYGSATAIPVLTVDAKGRITSATTASITTSTSWSALTAPTADLTLTMAGFQSTFNFTGITGTQTQQSTTNSASSGTTTVNSVGVALVGTNNAGGANTVNGINFAAVTAKTNNTFNAINLGTGYTNIIVSGNVTLTAAGALTLGSNLSVNGIISGPSTQNLRLQATGSTTGNGNNGSIYFLNSSGVTRGRFDTNTATITATGGTITTSGGYTIHTFITDGTFTLNFSGDVEYLVIAGGGAGGPGSVGGGGGAGGMRTGTLSALNSGAYSITVGAGGSGNTNGHGNNGADSIFSSITSTGGGGGGDYQSTPGQAGGSGGGAGSPGPTPPLSGGTGISGQGYAGGSVNVSTSLATAGGGGAGAVGQDGVSHSGNGGSGFVSSISGSSVTYAGGGGGAADSGPVAGNGGLGGGGAGGSSRGSTGGTGVPDGANGTTNSGGGGGGSGVGFTTGGNGGSGIVIVRYLAATANNYGTFYLGSTSISSADLAEYYVAGDSSISAGDLVMISQKSKVKSQNGKDVDTKGVLMKTDTSYDSKLLGIISTNPGVLMNSIDDDTGKEDKRMLALAGRVPVKIAPDSPAIAIGDFLTSSATYPGMAMKAVKAGYTVGKALEDWYPDGTDRIEAFVNLSFYDPDVYLTDLGNISIAKVASNNIEQDLQGQETQTSDVFTPIPNAIYKVSDNTGQSFERLGVFSQAVVGTLKVGSIDVSELTLSGTNINKLLGLSLLLNSSNASSSGTATPEATIAKPTITDQSILSRLDSLEKLVLGEATQQSSTSGVLNSLSVFGKSTMSDIGITGIISQGLLTINGLNTDLATASATINTITNDLYLQNQLLGGINILNGRILIDKDGNLVSLNTISAKTIQFEELKSTSSSSGRGIIVANTTSVDILSPLIKDSSKILVTPSSETGGAPLIVKTRTIGVGFKVIIEKSYATDITFDYLIVN